jgi:hypothetical protein
MDARTCVAGASTLASSTSACSSFLGGMVSRAEIVMVGSGVAAAFVLVVRGPVISLAARDEGRADMMADVSSEAGDVVGPRPPPAEVMDAMAAALAEAALPAAAAAATTAAAAPFSR